MTPPRKEKARKGYRVEPPANSSWGPGTKLHVLYGHTPPEQKTRAIMFHVGSRSGHLCLWVGEHERDERGVSLGSSYTFISDKRSLRAFANALTKALAPTPRRKAPRSRR